MKILRSLALFLLGGFVVTARAQEPFDAFVERAAAAWIKGDPQMVTATQYFSGAEQDALDRRLVVDEGATGLPIEPAARAARLAEARKLLDDLAKYDRSRLSQSQRTTLGIIEHNLRRLFDTVPLADHWFVFNQMSGLHVSLVNFLSQTHPVRNARDIENYLARLRLVGAAIDSGLGQARLQADKSILMPRFILAAVVGQVDRFVEPAPAKNVLVTSLDERAAKLANLPANERTRSVAVAEAVVRDEILPAYQRLRTMLAEQQARATDDAGIWRLPQGAAAYALALRINTTTNLTADEIHALGLREVARIEGEMDKVLRQLGYIEGAVAIRYAKCNATLMPPGEPDPRPALLAEYTRILRDSERRAETLFDLRPKAPVEVRREPPFTEKTAAAHYTSPAPDGTRPGIFWAPLPEILDDKLWMGAGMKSVTYHEAVPGHHFQIALQQELKEIPRYRQLGVFGRSSAYSEGWGLYAEKIAAEAGWYDGDLKGKLGQLQLELFRARRLVVDTGLHAKKWTRQQAIDYGIDATEVDRYVVWPGQACAYKVGELEILRLRAKAQEALGPKFSMKAFHNAVLRAGNVPLTVLGQEIDAYIQAAK